MAPEDPLFGPRVASALARLESGADPVRVASSLSRELGPDLGRRAAELHHLRRRAARRFPGAESMFFTPLGLEQASDPQVAAARATRIATLAPGETALDATCGIGADAHALVRAGLRVVAADRDPALLACARANLAAEAGRVWFVLAEATRPPARAPLLLLDPDRRAGGGRSLDPEAWSPPLSAVLNLVKKFEGACVKLAPALEVAWLRPDLPHRWTWVSRRRELAEVALWTGSLAGPDRPDGVREVLALDGRGGELRFAGTPVEVAPLEPEAAARVAFIAEPDPAVIRAGLVGRLARDEGLAPLGPGLAYLGGASAPGSGLLARFRVLGSAPADPRRVRALLAEHDVGPIEVKKRGHPDKPETLARRFRGKGGRRGTLLVARLARGHRAYLVERMG